VATKTEQLASDKTGKR